MVLFNLMSYKVRKRSSLIHLLWTIILMMEPFGKALFFPGNMTNYQTRMEDIEVTAASRFIVVIK